MAKCRSDVVIRQIAPASSQNAVKREAISLAELAAALQIEYARLVRRAWRLYALAMASGGVAILWAGIGGPGYGLLVALAALLCMGGWLGSTRWRTLLALLGPLVFVADDVADIDALLDIGRCLELAPIFPMPGPDGTRCYPCADRTREVASALGRLLPRLDGALAPSRRRYLERCVIRASGRVDPHFGPEFLIGALLTLGPTSDGRVWRAVERLQGHHDVRVRVAAGECLRLLGRGRG